MANSVARESEQKSEQSEAEEGVAIAHLEALLYGVRLRVGVLQQLQSYRGREQYREDEAKAVKALRISQRSLKRLMRQ